MPIYTVYAEGMVYQTCKVEADSPEEAKLMVQNVDEEYKWTVYRSGEFGITNAVVEE